MLKEKLNLQGSPQYIYIYILYKAILTHIIRIS